MRKTILTGDRPTGALHLGHYVGSLENRVKLQKTCNTFIIIADIQAMTDYFDRSNLIKQNVYQLVEDYLACGILPEHCNIFLQSKVSALAEMTIYFMNLVSVARVKRNPTIKEELLQKNFKNNLTCGFMCYPISQAADILAFQADIVPVGQDQIPMIEQTNEIVDAFNKVYSCNVLRKCEPVISETSKLMGIDGKFKASKSLNNAIFLNDSKEVVKDKVFKMYTDPDHIRITDPGKIEGNMVFNYLDIFYKNTKHLNELKLNYQQGGLGDVVLKNILFKSVEEFLQPIRENRCKITKNQIKDVLEFGNEKANKQALKVLNEMKNAMNLFV